MTSFGNDVHHRQDCLSAELWHSLYFLNSPVPEQFAPLCFSLLLATDPKTCRRAHGNIRFDRFAASPMRSH
jgi:hypothetical protein